MTERFAGRNKTAADAYFKADYYGTMVGPTVNFINNISDIIFCESIKIVPAVKFGAWGGKLEGQILPIAALLTDKNSPINQ